MLLTPLSCTHTHTSKLSNKMVCNDEFWYNAQTFKNIFFSLLKFLWYAIHNMKTLVVHLLKSNCFYFKFWTSNADGPHVQSTVVLWTNHDLVFESKLFHPRPQWLTPMTIINLTGPWISHTMTCDDILLCTLVSKIIIIWTIYHWGKGSPPSLGLLLYLWET